MDFSLPNSESWDTNPLQDKFINDYFFKYPISDSQVSKPKKKKRKYFMCIDSQDSLLKIENETHMLKRKYSENKNTLLSKTGKLKKHTKESSNEELSSIKINDTCSNSQIDHVKKRKKNIKKSFEVTEDSKKLKKSLRKNKTKTIQNDVNEKLKIETSKSNCKINQIDLNIGRIKKEKADKVTTNIAKRGLNNKKPIKKSNCIDVNNKTYFSKIDLAGDKVNEIDTKNNLINKKLKKSEKISTQVAHNKHENTESDTDEALRNEIKNSLVYQNLKQFGNIDVSKDQIIKNQPEINDKQNFIRSKDKTPLFETSSNLRNQAQKNLQAAKFRYLNQKLYTMTGKEAFQYFQDNYEEFDEYHAGYQLQVSKWPINPVDLIIKDISKSKFKVIADMGCGEAKIAQAFPQKTIYSFDLVALNKYVQACDISKVNLPNESVDVVVFCLSLMGVNLKDYLLEANRILKIEGLLKIAEVESRIDDLKIFIKKIEEFGFTLINSNVSHKLFVFLDFSKSTKSKKNIPNLSLKPCLYKKR